MNKKTIVIHPALAPYRVDFFNSLNQFYSPVFYFQFKHPREQSFNQNLLHKRINFTPRYLKRGLWGLKNLQPEILKIFSSEKPDLVIISEYNLIGLLTLLYKWITFKKFKIITICDDSIEMAKKVSKIKFITRKVHLRYLDGVILCNPEVTLYYKEQLNSKAALHYFPIIQSDKLFRNELNAALPITKELNITYKLSNKKVILFVGRLAKEKNISLLIKTYSRLLSQFPDLFLVIVGAGPLETELKKLAGELSMENFILFTGKKEGTELLAYYNLGDIFVLPSICEAFGTVVNEALLAGCMVVCSSKAGAGCLIREPVNGAIFNPQIKDELGKKLQTMIETTQCNHSQELRENKMLLHYDELINQFTQYIHHILIK